MEIISTNKYPWDLWFNGEMHKLVRGVHFADNITAKNFRTQCYIKAKSKNKKISTKIINENLVDESLILQASSEGQSNMLTLADQRSQLSTKFDERELIEGYKDTLELTEFVFNKLNAKSDIEFVEGRDYDIPTKELVRMIYSAAKRQGVDTSSLKYKKTSCGIRFYVEEAEKNIEKIIDKLTKIPDREIKKEIFSHKIYFYDPTGYLREQSPKYCSGCGGLLKRSNIEEKIEVFPYLYRTIKLSELAAREGRPLNALEKIELRWPIDFTCTNRVLAAKIRDEAIARNLNISSWYFDADTDKNKLTILCGTLAEKKREEDAEKYLQKIIQKKLNEPPSRVFLEEKIDELAEKNWLQLEFGRDYFCPEKVLLKWMDLVAKQKGVQIETVIPESKLGISEKYGITFTTRKSMIDRWKAKEGESAEDTMNRFYESGYGQVVDQPRVEQRKEIEHQLRIKNEQQDKRKVLLERLERLESNLDKMTSEKAKENSRNKINMLKEELLLLEGPTNNANTNEENKNDNE